MDRFAGVTGRQYRLFRYTGHPDAERVVVAIGSGCEVLDETATYLNEQGERTGVLQVTLYRPWHADAFLAALPRTVKAIAVLDRTKEPGALGDPLYLDVLGTFAQAVASGTWGAMPRLIGGRYGLSSKDFDPAMAKAVFDELDKARRQTRVHRRHHRRRLAHEPRRRSGVRHRAARRRACAVLRPRRRRHGWRQQELREDPRGRSPPLRARLLRLRLEEVRLVHDLASALRPEARARAVLARSRRASSACTSSTSCSSRTCLPRRRPAPRFSSTARTPADAVWDELPRRAQQQIIDKQLRLFVIDASRVAFDLGLGCAQQHHSADVLLRAVRRAAARRGDRRDQAGNRKDLRPQGGGDREEELRGHRQCARQPARSGGAPRCDRDACHREDGAGLRRPRSCATSSP